MSVEDFPRNGRPGSKEHDPSESLVEDLIRMADAGPDLPQGGSDRLKEGLRPLWQAEVRSRARRRRKGLVMGGLATAAGIILAVAVMSHLRPRTPSMGAPVAFLESVVGELEITPAAGIPQRVGVDQRGLDILPDALLAVGPGDRAALRLAGGQSLRLDSSTSLLLVTAEVMRLNTGAIYIDSQGPESSGVEVLTAFGTARDIGTQFEVRQEGSGLMIRVREGVVELESDGGKIEIESGIEAKVASDGSCVTRSISGHDPAWRWVQEVAPVVEIEGRTVKATLGWVSRETGFEIRYSGPELEAFAEDTVLHGSAEGLTPGEVPDLVLPGCGLESIQRNGVLTIQRQHEDG